VTGSPLTDLVDGHVRCAIGSISAGCQCGSGGLDEDRLAPVDSYATYTHTKSAT
jgi:hypothetical protein